MKLIRGQRCSGKTSSGERCSARATSTGFCFFHSDPAKAAELGKLGGRKSHKPPILKQAPIQIPMTASEVKTFLAESMTQVRNGGLDSRTGATIAFMANALLKAIEVADFEAKITALEIQNACEPEEQN
jgi:hypothetical protein